MRIPSHLRSGALGFNMTPMIDVVFLLIIFFLVSSHLAKQEVQMQLPLPTAESGNQRVEDDVPRLTVNVLSDGTLMLSGRHVVSRRTGHTVARPTERSRTRPAGADPERSECALSVRRADHARVCQGRHLGRLIFRLSAGGCSLMRRPSPFVDRRSDMEIKMTPMIDVVFLLLIFFLWTASFQIVEMVLPSNLSEVAGSTPTQTDEPPPPQDDFDRVVLRVRWIEGRPMWQINDAAIDNLQQVRSRLETIAAVKRDAPVILHPDQEVPLGHVIDLYDLTRLVGFEQIQFAASEKI